MNANLRMREEVMEEYCEREARVLTAVLEHLLPRVGPHVRTLDLAHGKAVSNEIVSLLVSLPVTDIPDIPGKK